MFEMRPYRRNSMSTWNPFSEMEEMERRLFNNDFFSGRGLAEFKTDITDEGDYYELKADLPGFKKDDISVSLNNGYLTVSASRCSEHEDKAPAAEDEASDSKCACASDSGKWLRRERYMGSCSRSFYVGEDVKESDIHASYRNGTLCIQVPKMQAQPQVESKHQIAIEG